MNQSDKELLKFSGKKILITGGNGMLGTAFREILNDVSNCLVYTFSKNELDVTNQNQVLNYKNEKFDYIIHCAGKINADYCEEHPNESYEILVKGTSNIIQLAKATRAKMLFPQSFLIFDGTSSNIDENTIPNPLCVYGKHKLESEIEIMKELPNALIVRMGGFFGGREMDKNFVGKITKHISKLIQDKINTIEIGDRIWQPTFTNDLAFNSLLLLLEGKEGKFNMASHGHASFYELTKEIISILNLGDKIRIIPINSKKFSNKEKAKRPEIAIMQNKRLESEGIDRQRNWEESLREYLTHDYFRELF